MTAPPGDGMPPGPEGRGRLRASQTDRERVVGMLKVALVQGQLTKDEFDARVGQALTARTYADLAVLTTDLPTGLIVAPPLRRAVRAPAQPSGRTVARPGARWVTAVAAAGLLAGIVSAALQSPTFTSSALLLTPSRYSPATQVAMARSDPVMAGALHRLDSGGSMGALHKLDSGGSVVALRERVQVKSLTSSVLSVSAQGATAAQAERAAGAVAASYLTYVASIAPSRHESAAVLDPPARATETPRSARLLVTGGLGALLGALIGVLGMQAFRRSRPRFGVR